MFLVLTLLVTVHRRCGVKARVEVHYLDAMNYYDTVHRALIKRYTHTVRIIWVHCTYRKKSTVPYWVFERTTNLYHIVGNRVRRGLAKSSISQLAPHVAEFTID